MLDTSMMVLLALTAALAGFVDAIAGGGGLIMMPALFSVGLPPHIVLGTNKLISSCGTALAAIAYIQKGLFKPRFWLSCIGATLVGSILGAVTIRYLDASLIKKAMPLIIFAVAIYLLIPKKHPDPTVSATPAPRLPQTAAGIGMGFYDGFVGPGTGTFWTVIALRIFRQEIVQAAGLARFMNLVSNIAALTAFALLGSVNWQLGLLLGLANIVGGYIGAHSAIRFGAPFIRPAFITLVLLIASRLLYLEFFI